MMMSLVSFAIMKLCADYKKLLRASLPLSPQRRRRTVGDFTLPILVALFYAWVFWKTPNYTGDLERPKHLRRQGLRAINAKPLDLRAEWEGQRPAEQEET